MTVRSIREIAQQDPYRGAIECLEALAHMQHNDTVRPDYRAAAVTFALLAVADVIAVDGITGIRR